MGGVAQSAQVCLTRLPIGWHNARFILCSALGVLLAMPTHYPKAQEFHEKIIR
jgi:hypothetical protein